MKRLMALLAAMTMVAVIAPRAVAAPGNPVLMVSDNADRTGNPRPLDGEALTGAAFVWVSPNGARVDRVGFTLDGQAGSSSMRAPWSYTDDLMMTTAVLANGQHTMKAGVHRPNGGLTELAATFTTTNDTAAQVMVADSPDRTLNRRPLDGASLVAGQPYYVFVGPEPEGPYGVGMVRFSEGVAGTETVPPFDLNATADNGDAVPATFAAGPHTLLTSISVSCRGTGPAQCERTQRLMPQYDLASNFDVVSS